MRRFAQRNCRFGLNTSHSAMSTLWKPVPNGGDDQGRNYTRLAAMGAAMLAGYKYLDENTWLEPQVFAFGSGQFGQLGTGGETDLAMPHPIAEIDPQKVISMNASGRVSALLCDDGVYTFGQAKDGVLGHPSSGVPQNVPIPTLVEELFDEKIVRVKCGEGHMAAITEKGELFTWGKNFYGQLGHAPKEGKVSGSSRIGELPEKVTKGLEGKKVIDAACSYHTTICLCEDGTVYSWGENKSATLGREDCRKSEYPTQVLGLENEKIVQIESGRDFVVARNEKGEIFTWGTNDYGQLGFSIGSKFQEVPRKIRTIARNKIVDFSCGEFHVIAISDQGEAFVWGKSNEGQLGFETKNNLNVPKKLEFAERFQSVSCGGGHSLFVTKSGKVFAVGRGRNGQLGLESSGLSIAGARFTPILVEFFKDYTITDIKTGSDHTLVFTDSK